MNNVACAVRVCILPLQPLWLLFFACLSLLTHAPSCASATAMVVLKTTQTAVISRRLMTSKTMNNLKTHQVSVPSFHADDSHFHIVPSECLCECPHVCFVRVACYLPYLCPVSGFGLCHTLISMLSSFELPFVAHPFHAVAFFCVAQPLVHALPCCTVSVSRTLVRSIHRPCSLVSLICLSQNKA